MPERNIAGAVSPVGSGSYIAGDTDPSDFNYTNALSRHDLLSLLLRNGKVQKATVWFAGEILRERWEFAVDQAIQAPKHGLPYTFKTFNEWLEWNGFLQEVNNSLMWSLLFGEAILVFFKDGEIIAKDDVLTGLTSYDLCRAYYPITDGNGYVLEDVDQITNTPNLYRIELRAQQAKGMLSFKVEADRVVRFPAPKKELKFAGTSTVSAIAHDCLAQEQIKRAVVTQANNLIGGIVAIKAADDNERELVDNAVGDTLTHLRRVYFKNPGDIDNLVKIIVPDLNITQLEDLNNILQTDIATGMDMSKSVLEGAPQGTISSAGFNTYNTYTKVKQLQSHYKRAMEKAFFKLGKMDTTFTWNDPTPREAEPAAATPMATEPSAMKGADSQEKVGEEQESKDDQ
jgi:hypothetical protein